LLTLQDKLTLPPEPTLVGDAVKAGLRDSGYRVIEPDDVAYSSAPKVNVRIDEFWTWVTPGFGSIKLDAVAKLALEGDLPTIRTPATVSVRESKGYFAITESKWAPFIDGALVKVREQVRSIMGAKTAAAPDSALGAVRQPPS